jgi:hypothetical protein
MAARRLSLLFGLLAAFLAVAWLTAPAPACPFCSEERGPTLVGDFGQASMVLLGTFSNPRFGNGGALEEGATDFNIEKVLKPHEIIKGKKVITLPRYINQVKNKFVVFCDVYKERIDPYRGVELLPDSKMVDYLTGAVAIKDKPAPDRLRYCFDYLNSPEIDIALDAYREYAKADYKEYRNMARKLPADTLADWLKDPKTPPYRYGLYASLLGHCGTDKHAKLLKEMMDDAEKRRGSGLDGMLAAYIMIKPKEGWAYLGGMLKDEKEDFMVRYAALRTIRFIWEQRPDLISKKDLVKGLELVLAQGDMADFAIEDLRKWQRWEMTGTVLDLWGKKSHDVPVVRRAILRYALRSPEARAVAFVREQRQRDAEWVKDTEELLKLENDVPANGTQASSK